MLVGRRTHDPTHVGTAGEEDVVEPELQQSGSLRNASSHHLDQVPIEVGGHQPRHESCHVLRELGWLDEDGVSGREGTDHRTKAQLGKTRDFKVFGSKFDTLVTGTYLHWIVPCSHDQRHSVRFSSDVGAIQQSKAGLLRVLVFDPLRDV